MVFGLSDNKQATKTKPADNKKSQSPKKGDGAAADEAQQLLEEMQAKEDNGDCAFC